MTGQELIAVAPPIAESMQALLTRWRTHDIVLLPPERRDTVVAAFAQIGARATEDVIALYTRFGGMEEMDEGMLAIWPLRQLMEDDENRKPSKIGPLFADYMISAWCYRLRPVSDSVSEVYVDYFTAEPPRLIAPSLAHWLAEYAQDPEAPHGW